MSAVSLYWLLVDRGQDAAKHLPMHKTASQQRIIWPKCQLYQETLQTTFDMLDHASHSTFSIHCTNLFLCFSWVFTFVEIVKHNMPKMCISSIFNIKMATQKFTNFDVFLKCVLIWQLSQYNLTKLFQMKLKTTKHH